MELRLGSSDETIHIALLTELYPSEDIENTARSQRRRRAMFIAAATRCAISSIRSVM